MAMTVEQLKKYLQNNPVDLGWAAVTTIELGAANSLLENLFKKRPVGNQPRQPVSIDIDTSPNETVSFSDLRFGLPVLQVQADARGAIVAGEAVLRFGLVGGTYTVIETTSSASRLAERIEFDEAAGYLLSIRFPLQQLQGSVTAYGAVKWSWTLTGSEIPSVNLGTAEATSNKIAAELFAHVRGLGPLDLPVLTHYLPTDFAGPLRPQSFRLALSASGENDNAYALNLFSSTAQLPTPGSLPGPSYPYLLPKKIQGGGYEYTAALFVAQLFKPMLPIDSANRASTEATVSNLLHLISEQPSASLNAWLGGGESLNTVAFGQAAQADSPPLAARPLLTPAAVTRRLGIARQDFATEEAWLHETRPVTFQANGLSGHLNWTLETLVADGEPQPWPAAATLVVASDRQSATLTVREDLPYGFYHLKVTASGGASNEATASVFVVPTALTLAVKPFLQPVDGEGMAYFDTSVTDAQVVGGAAQGEVEVTDSGFVYTAASPYQTGLAAIHVANGPRREGYAVVDLARPAALRRHWLELSNFKLELKQGPQLFANGRQQLAVTITIGTQALGDGSYIPVTDAELSTLRLMIKGSPDMPVDWLPAGLSEIPDDFAKDHATGTEANRYRFYNGGSPAVEPQAAAENERVVTLYFMTRQAGNLELIAEFYSENGRWVSEVTNENEGKVTANALQGPALIEDAYSFTSKVVGATFPSTCVPSGSMDVSNCLRSTSYWSLTFNNRSTSVVPFVDLRFDAQPGLPTANSSIMRWESDRMAETMFSYTGFAFQPYGAGASGESMQYDAWLEWFMRLRGKPLRHEFEDVLVPGELRLGLFRDDDTLFWDDNEEDLKDPHPLRTFTHRLDGRPLWVTLTDVDGNRHPLQIDFAKSKGPNGHRDGLSFAVRGSASSQQGKQAASPGQPRAWAGDRLHSNAFNFASFVNGGVDPRTGLYTVAIQLPELKANALAGPALPLRLSYSPVSSLDSGFGLGWSLNLTRYTPQANNILTLHSGESYKVTGSGAEPGIEERKLEHFRFYADSASRWRVVHLDGLVEHLQLLSQGSGQVALPVRWEAPSGHGVNLAYETANGHLALKTVTDEQGTVLLEVDRGAALVRVRAYPGPGGTELARFDMALVAGEVRSLSLPVDEGAKWAFEYGLRDGYRFIEKVWTPVGAREELEYNDAGHFYPDPQLPKLPRVTRYLVHPGQGQATEDTRYTYTTGNFLGGNSGIVWSDDGLDNLYKVGEQYTYGTVEEQWLDGEAVRTIQRTFNHFHLLTIEETRQADHVKRVTTQYHYEPGKLFRDQPAKCQLPKADETRWTRPDGATRFETTLTDFDHYGHLVDELKPTGVRTVNLYYPAAGEPGNCPADPYGFARHLKSSTVHPAADGEGVAPTLVTHYRYETLPALASSSAPAAVVPVSESLSEAGAVNEALREVISAYLDQPTEPLLHGRLSQQVRTLSGISTTTAFTYALGDSQWLEQSVLLTTRTVTGLADVEAGSRGTVQRVINEEHSLLNGQVLLERDDNDVEVRYHYDALQRVTAEILAPGTPYEAARQYHYGLAVNGEPAWQVEEDVQGVRLTTLSDGRGRAVEQWRAEPGEGSTPQGVTTFRRAGLQIYAARYDGLGQQIEETLYDDCGQAGRSVALTTTYEYDGWGERCAQQGPDGVKAVEQTDPVGDGSGAVVSRWQESVDGSLKSAVVVTRNNLFGEPVTVTRQYQDDDAGDVEYESLTYGYDGLGRRVREESAWSGGTTRVTTFTLDAFDRDLEQTLPDGATVVRRYSPHSDADLPVEISVDGTLLGTQAFDGLDRMIRATTGGRERTFTFDGSLNRPTSVITPKGELIEYEYQPRLGEEPIQRRTGLAADERYDYDTRTARLLACHQQREEVMTRTYHTNGQLKDETRTLDGQRYAMHYQYSVGERLLGYTEVTGDEQRYHYDDAGRLVRTEVGPAVAPVLTCALTYDALGRPSTIDTQDHDAGHWLTTTLSYDALGRETERRFMFDGQEEILTQRYDDADCIIEKTLSQDGQVLREEFFEYDERQHLSYYECSGPACPVDPYGKTIAAQLFICDSLDNHLEVTTTWSEAGARQLREARRGLRTGASSVASLAGRVNVEELNIATYLYEGEDPVQLTGIENTHADYPPRIDLTYDEDGNLTRDDAGRELAYDPLGRLMSVSTSPGETASTYQYDPTDIISGRSGDAAPEHRFYRDGQLATLVQGEQSISIVRAAEHLIAERSGTPAMSGN